MSLFHRVENITPAEIKLLQWEIGHDTFNIII
jgi:hypothetical protein